MARPRKEEASTYIMVRMSQADKERMYAAAKLEKFEQFSPWARRELLLAAERAERKSRKAD